MGGGELKSDLVSQVKILQYPLFCPNILLCPHCLSKATTNQSMVHLVVRVKSSVFLSFSGGCRKVACQGEIEGQEVTWTHVWLVEGAALHGRVCVAE